MVWTFLPLKLGCILASLFFIQMFMLSVGWLNEKRVLKYFFIMLSTLTNKNLWLYERCSFGFGFYFLDDEPIRHALSEFSANMHVLIDFVNFLLIFFSTSIQSFHKGSGLSSQRWLLSFYRHIFNSHVITILSFLSPPVLEQAKFEISISGHQFSMIIFDFPTFFRQEFLPWLAGPLPKNRVQIQSLMIFFLAFIISHHYIWILALYHNHWFFFLISELRITSEKCLVIVL